MLGFWDLLRWDFWRLRLLKLYYLNMRTSEALGVFSQIINFIIFINFILLLLKMNVLDIGGLLISAFGLFSSIIVSIISVVEERSGR